MKKIGKMNEMAWVLGVVLCTLGVCLCTKANFGLSMIATPPYILHLKLIKFFPWYSQGTSEYIWQGVLLILMCIGVQRFKARFLLSFVSGVIAGVVLDAWITLFGGNGAYTEMSVRIAAFVAGELITALAIAFYFRTSMPLQIYELIVVEVADRFKLDKNRTKLYNDIIMLALSFVFALLLNGSFRGIGYGTVIITLVNAQLITLFGKLLDRIFTFEPRFERFTAFIHKS